MAQMALDGLFHVKGGAMGLSELLSTYGEKYLQGLLTTWQLTAISFVFVMLLAVGITIMRVSPL